MSRPMGVLLKQEKGHGVFLTPDGGFVRGRPLVLGAQIGQEVEFVPIRANIAQWVRYGLVAVLMLAVMVAGVSVYLTRPVIAAYVTIDINPSVELGVDSNRVVRSVAAINPEAEPLIAGVELVGRPVTEAFETVIANATQGGYLAPESENIIVITTTGVAGKPANDEALTAELDNRAREMVAGQKQTVVASMVADPEVREQARKQGVSVGRLLVAQKAEEAGIHIDPEQLKSANLSQSIRSAGGDPSLILKSDSRASDNDRDDDDDDDDDDDQKANSGSKTGKSDQSNGKKTNQKADSKGNAKDKSKTESKEKRDDEWNWSRQSSNGSDKGKGNTKVKNSDKDKDASKGKDEKSRWNWPVSGRGQWR